MKRQPQEQAVPRRAMVEQVPPPPPPQQLPSPPSPPPVTWGAAKAWHPLPLDTPVRLLGRTDVIAVQGDEYVAASILPVVLGVLALDLAPMETWRNGGERPRYRFRQVPGFTTVASLALARGLAPTSAFYLPGLAWRRMRPPLVMEHGKAISLAEAFARLPWDDGPRTEAVAQVDNIRALYGRALADIAYRIENSALFDSTVPTTRQFETALALWSDVMDSTSHDEVVRRSAVVAVAFRTARSHAETVGLGHLPTTAHDGARRAVGAARLARSSASEAERDNAQARVVSILRSLALDCLPDPAELPRAITSGQASERGAQRPEPS